MAIYNWVNAATSILALLISLKIPAAIKRWRDGSGLLGESAEEVRMKRVEEKVSYLESDVLVVGALRTEVGELRGLIGGARTEMGALRTLVASKSPSIRLLSSATVVLFLQLN